ncbi:MAG TPA: LysE family translocator [Gammaproteobacteria bacterium]
MTLETFLAFCALELVLCLTPGPAVIYVISTALGRGVRAGLAAALGIVAGNTLYFFLSALGVAAIILASHAIFTVLKWIGAAYLVYVGARMLLSRREPVALRPQPVAQSFARGFAVQAANPKALAFFVALLPQFIDPTANVAWQVLILGLASQTIEITVLGLYVWLTGRAQQLVGGRFGTIVERVAGGFLIAAGARLALARAV